ncbi:hypothetical protein [Mammaliicoccus sciuri]|uniref:hypothetical protein n=1 Tax=Mammaliicoccus sciuri TaxID=1296 RepID=UPI001D16A684|nr:hypothetical protein [Mammaliicoccus sciuri]
MLYTLSNIYSNEKAYDRCLAYAQSALDITIKSNRYMLYSELVYNIVQSRLEMGILNDTDKKQLEIALFLSEQSKKHNITILIRDLMKTL